MTGDGFLPASDQVATGRKRIRSSSTNSVFRNCSTLGGKPTGAGECRPFDAVAVLPTLLFAAVASTITSSRLGSVLFPAGRGWPPRVGVLKGGRHLEFV